MCVQISNSLTWGNSQSRLDRVQGIFPLFNFLFRHFLHASMCICLKSRETASNRIPPVPSSDRPRRRYAGRKSQKTHRPISSVPPPAPHAAAGAGRKNASLKQFRLFWMFDISKGEREIDGFLFSPVSALPPSASGSWVEADSDVRIRIKTREQQRTCAGCSWSEEEQKGPTDKKLDT